MSETVAIAKGLRPGKFRGVDVDLRNVQEHGAATREVRALVAHGGMVGGEAAHGEKKFTFIKQKKPPLP